MGYIIAIVLIVVFVPLLFLMLSRRTHSTGGVAEKQPGRGVTVSRPTAEEPTPRADGLNQPQPGQERRMM